MNRAIVVLTFLLLGAGMLSIGCVRQGTPTPTSSPTTTLPVTPSPTPTVVPTTPSATPTPTVPGTPAATPTPTVVPTTPAATPTPTAAIGVVFFLKVTSPENEAIVDTASIEVAGQTTPDSAVSVNGQFVEIDASGRFKTRVNLVPGVNTIDVLASDFSGRRAAAEVLTVLYVAR